MIDRSALHGMAIALLAALAGCGSGPVPQPSPSAEASPSNQAPSSPASELASAPEPEAGTASDAVPATASPARYAPRDDCAGQPGWPAFRKALVAAIKARDAQALARLAAPDIALDYGGGGGTAELVARLNDPATGLWRELDAILPLGCALQGGLAAMPWVFWHLPENIDSGSSMLVLGEDTSLLDRASGKPLAPIGWTIVTIDPDSFDPKRKTAQVTTQDGSTGWVATSALRSTLDYRLIVEPKDGKWLITAFIAGD